MRRIRVRPLRAEALSALAVVAWVIPLSAQEPPDTVLVSDSLVTSVSGAIDSSTVADSLIAGDSVSADTIFYNLPRRETAEPASFATGVWEWDRADIMADGANNLAELFRTLPGVVALLGGDYGTPASITAFGSGGGGYRILRDGLEVYAVEGGVPNLQLIGLAGISKVRLDRSMGQMVIEMWSYEYEDGRPFSIIEAGTGDLDTNLFRGIYADPTALGGSVAVGLERMDTRGRGREGTEAGNRTGSWVRYQVHAGDRLGFAIDYRGFSTQTEVPEYTPITKRSDASVRAAYEPLEGLTLSAIAGRSTYGVDSVSDSSVFQSGSRAQLGGSLGIERGIFWLRSSYESFEGSLPSGRVEARSGISDLRWGGVSGSWSSSMWNDVEVTSFGARAWLKPTRFTTLFASYADGSYGSRVGVLSEVMPPMDPSSSVTETGAEIVNRTGGRAGVIVGLSGVTLGGAALYGSADQVLPLGLELDDGAAPVAGVERNGYEGMLVLPTFMKGLTLEGSYHYWDEEGPYQPSQIYRGSFQFHRVFLESGNLELWASFGVLGHDSMQTFVADNGSGAGSIARVPFYQSWYMQAQVRIVTVRLWLGMDNITLRRNLQVYPDRLLPYGRSFFGLRWDLWN